MCGRNFWLIGICALALGSAIVVVAIFPTCFVMFLVAFLLIFCGIGLLKKR